MSAPKLLPALLGGLFIGVLSSLPYVKGGNVCCCLWVVSGGALAAWLMQQNTPRPVTVGEGAIVGLLSGLVGTAVWIVWGVLALAIFSVAPFDLADFQRAMGEAEGMTPEAREALESLSPAVMLVVGGVIWTVVSAIFATLGGLLGALIFRRKGGPTAGVPNPPVPPTFTPPTFTPAGPAGPPPFSPPPPPGPPPASPVNLGKPVNPGSTPFTPPGTWTPSPPEEPYAGDAPTIMIPARGAGLPLPPAFAPPSASPGAPPPGTVPPGDREPESH